MRLKCILYFLGFFLLLFLVSSLLFTGNIAQATVANASIAANTASDLIAGANDVDYNVSFNTNITATATTITVTFPVGYIITDGVIGTAATAICNNNCVTPGVITVNSSNVTVTSVTGSASARTMVVTISPATNLSVGATSFRFLQGIKNPTVSGATGTFSLKTNATGETTATVSAVTIAAGPVTHIAFIVNPSENIVEAAGSSGNSLAYSYDGINWTGTPGSTSVFSTAGNKMYWNGTIWVAVGQGASYSMAYSYDGINWIGATGSKTIFSTWGLSASWNGTMWVAMGKGTNTIAYSYDGINWTAVPESSTIFTTAGNRTLWNGSMWVAVGQGTTNTIAYSYDGVHWTGAGNVISDVCTEVAWNGSMWVCAGSGTDNTLAYSYDGIHWQGVSASKSIFSGGWATYVDWNGSMWLVGGQGDNSLAYSYDGINWTAVAGSSSIFASSGYFSWNGNKWVASGRTPSNSIAYSYDGINWTGVPGSSSIFTNQGSRNLWIGNKWVTGGNSTSDTMAYSYDGINWTGLGKSIFSASTRFVAFDRRAPYGSIKNDTVFAHQPVIAAQDQYGNTNTSYTGTVTISKTSGAGTLAGTLTKSFSSGVADFSGNGLKYTATADQEPFTLSATDGAFSTTSSLIADVVATKLVFTTQPGNAVTNTPLATQPVLKAEDDKGLVDVNFNDLVTLTPSIGTGTISNNSLRATSGIITFSNLTYNPSGNKETFALRATANLNSNDEYILGATLPTVDSNSAIGNPDLTPPVLSMLGDSSVSIYQGSSYTDLGALAIDGVDGNITSSVTVASNLDTSTPGSYFITYSVSDTAGNHAAPVTRIVNVLSSGGGSVIYNNPSCSSVTYGDFSASCFGGYQYRSIISRIPDNCTPTAIQQENDKRACLDRMINPNYNTMTVGLSLTNNYVGSASSSSSTNEFSFISLEKSLTTTIDKSLASRLSGYILLQIQSHGEAWYVNPLDSLKYYLGTPNDAFSLMKELALGISNKTFNSFKNNTAPLRLSGRILINIENNGKAYYVHPGDLKLYYLGRPEDAFNLMRSLGLGITNSDLRKIKIGN